MNNSFSYSLSSVLKRGLSIALWLGLSCAAAIPTVSAQTAPAASTTLSVGSVVQLQGLTLDQKNFDIRQLRGNVVLLVAWRTDCAVCREQMRELRDNTKGWDDKPFASVLISTDSRMADLTAYNSFINQVLPPSERLRQLWLQEPQFKDNLGLQHFQNAKTAANLPLFFIVNQRGELVERHSGRLPATVWERIAFLM